MLNLGNSFNPSPSNNGTLTSLNLSKGMSLDLTKHANLKRVRFGLGWQAGNGEIFDLDASALILNARGLVTDPQDVIFYNQPDTNRGVRSEGDNKVGSYTNVGEQDDETIIVDLDRVPSYAESILFIVTIHEANLRHQNFGMVKQAYIRVVDDDTNQELARYNLNEKFELQVSCEIAKLTKTPHGWDFTALGNGRNDELASILISYGVS